MLKVHFWRPLTNLRGDLRDELIFTLVGIEREFPRGFYDYLVRNLDFLLQKENILDTKIAQTMVDGAIRMIEEILLVLLKYSKLFEKTIIKNEESCRFFLSLTDLYVFILRCKC